MAVVVVVGTDIVVVDVSVSVSDSTSEPWMSANASEGCGCIHGCDGPMSRTRRARCIGELARLSVSVSVFAAVDDNGEGGTRTYCDGDGKSNTERGLLAGWETASVSSCFPPVSRSPFPSPISSFSSPSPTAPVCAPPPVSYSCPCVVSRCLTVAYAPYFLLVPRFLT